MINKGEATRNPQKTLINFLARVSTTIAADAVAIAFRVLYWWRQQCRQISNECLEIFKKIITLLTVTILFLFTFFNLILDAPRTSETTIYQPQKRALHRKFETNIARYETPGPRSQFLHSCICERFIYCFVYFVYCIQENTYISPYCMVEPWRIDSSKRKITVTSSLTKYPRISWEIGYWWGVGEELLRRPHPFYSRHLDRYLKTTWTVFPPSQIIALWIEPQR